eukprot:27183_1
MLFFLLLVSVVSCIHTQFPTPFRSWQSGVFTGNPVYSPVGPFSNYTVILRENDGKTYPPNFLMIETSIHSFDTTNIRDTYQQWTIYDTQISYCGLLTYTHGTHYIMTHPQLVYQPQLSSEYEIYFCADPRGGACDTLWWQWKYNNNTQVLIWNSTLSRVPHEFVSMNFMGDDLDFPIQTEHRSMCVNALGNEMPYNYDWVGKNESSVKLERFNSDNRQRLRDNIPHYHKHYKHRAGYKHEM